MLPADGLEPIRHLYIHVPFCARRCAYCDFSIAVRKFVPVDDYLRGIELELARYPLDGSLTTLYLGGGTPSRLGGDGIERLIEIVTRHFPLATDAEVTMEANPDDVSDRRIAAWRRAGVNRLSIG